ncbi:MAG: GspE/PulE family protein [Candidatus Pacebacteria bacterium]|nr:GspE/PulE family protein [Candidatus Paceibacterota bacterium]MDD2757131.1 GspE/PulE family protein [Candidatus Paceibacterota bacterium]MDD3283598.1 GspE/PulE family protein [Candidatus Paceibacterota bacterium]MDD3969779.1 GspE/PulE family protein [Candidatus Paceibacterota bacterium]MDD4737989.1 GspE/PulE family protein [Candidatus Paceibacterota bacterium]
METIKNKIEIEKEIQEVLEQNITGIQALKKQITDSIGLDISVLLKTIMSGSILLNASDLHIEAVPTGSTLRTRIDGVLQEVFSFDKLKHQRIVSRIKLLSALKLNVSDKPQDGRFSIVFHTNDEIEIRVSTLPTEYGETVVMRVLNPNNLVNLEQLGLRKDIYQIFELQAKKPNGMIVVTGPTGSGKTTTLYAFLKKIRNPEIKVITIEDPIEYHLDGISQTQVNPKKGYNFAAGLKSIVRQDPDAILVGEIRDLETASISLQAALTGHLVLSTLHANEAAGTIARFQALGESPTNIAPAINTAIAQRLVRKVCPKCTEMKKITPELLQNIKEGLSGIGSHVDCPEINDDMEVAEIKGCEYCNFTGYKGRVGIFEAMLIDDEIEDFILTAPSTSALQKMAIKKGMTTMKQDGLIKVLKGVTTINEVIRVAG